MYIERVGRAGDEAEDGPGVRGDGDMGGERAAVLVDDDGFAGDDSDVSVGVILRLASLALREGVSPSCRASSCSNSPTGLP